MGVVTASLGRGKPGRRAGLRGSALLALTLASVVSPGCSSPDPDDAALLAGSHTIELSSGGDERSYILQLPAVAGDTRVPLVIAYHGGGGNAAGYQRYARLDALAEREGFAVVYPDGTSARVPGFSRLKTWNAGRCCGAALRRDVDDVAFTRAVVADITQRAPIDLRRVYATGHSNGAMMSYRLAVEAPDLVAAIAPVAGAMGLPDGLAPRKPVPVLHIHSVDDPRAVYQGGLGPPLPITGRRVEHAPVEDGLLAWIEIDGCPHEPQELEQRSNVQGHEALHLRYAPCTGRAIVELWKLTGVGHGWPGSKAVLRDGRGGEDSDVIDAATEIWRFVSRFSR